MSTFIFKRILIPTDFSEASLKALEKSKEIAPNSEMRLLHVLPPIAMVSNTISKMTHNVASRRRALEKLNKASGTETNVSCEVRFGNAAGEIVSAAMDWHTDLIVMPARSHGAIERALLGSVTEQVLRLANCPVLVLPVTS